MVVFILTYLLYTVYLYVYVPLAMTNTGFAVICGLFHILKRWGLMQEPIVQRDLYKQMCGSDLGHLVAGTMSD